MSLHLCSYCRKPIPDIALAARTQIADDECHCDHTLTAVAVRKANRDVEKVGDIPREELRHYLDGAIWAWRQKRDDPNTSLDGAAQAKAYIDAYQSVRVSMIGMCVPAADGTTVESTPTAELRLEWWCSEADKTRRAEIMVKPAAMRGRWVITLSDAANDPPSLYTGHGATLGEAIDVALKYAKGSTDV